MKMKLYYVVEDSGFDETTDCIMLAGSYGTFKQAEEVTWQNEFLGFSKVVEQTVEVKY